MSVKSKAEALLLLDLTAIELPPAVGVQFHAYREWKFDLAYYDPMVAIEINGRGRHQRERGERDDMEKMNAAIEAGWRVLVYPARSVTTKKRRKRIVEQIARIVCAAGESQIDSGRVLVGD